MYFQDLIQNLTRYWTSHGCLLMQGYDLEVGAGTMNPATFLRVLGPEPWKACYVEPSRRPADGRYGENPNRLYQHHQFQVVLKPNPKDVQQLYLDSLASLGILPKDHDLRFVHDDWESPTLGAWGLGWEVWCDGMEITQFTYFQQAGGIDCRPVTAELTYGLERICMYLQNKQNVFEIEYGPGVSYGEVFQRAEYEQSRYAFDESDRGALFAAFEASESEAKRLLELELPIPAYDHCLKCSHLFNMLDARGAISVTERAGFIQRVRALARGSAKVWVKVREDLGFPLLREGAEAGEPSLGAADQQGATPQPSAA